jgi:hypothetical protein
MDDSAKVEVLLNALRDIGQIAVEPGADPMKALQEAQDIAETALWTIETASPR